MQEHDELRSLSAAPNLIAASGLAVAAQYDEANFGAVVRFQLISGLTPNRPYTHPTSDLSSEVGSAVGVPVESLESPAFLAQSTVDA